MQSFPRRIRTIESLEAVTAELRRKHLSNHVISQWASWLIQQVIAENELVETRMIFAFRPVNINSFHY